MRAKKVDSNQKQIVETIRRMGASVQHLHTIGKGCPDILIGHKGQNYLVEIKDGAKVKSQKKLTPDEIKWHESWRGKVVIIENVEQAIKFLNG